MKRIVPIITVTAIILCLAKNIQVKASDITNNYDILALQPGIELTSIIDAYERLTTQQQLIAEYLVGAFNNIYLCARGFSYDITYDQSNLQAQFSALGSKVFDFITTRIGWKSRVNEVFRQYLSSVIVYASGINVSFASWFAGQVSGEDRQIYIPYSEDAFDAWTTFYNDPSGDGIANFGSYVSPWVSGNFYDFELAGYAWNNTNYESGYNNFVLNYSPILYSNLGYNANFKWQQLISFNNFEYPNALYVLNSQGFSYYCIGFCSDQYNLSKLTSNLYVTSARVSLQNNKLYFSGPDNNVVFFKSGNQHTSTTYYDLQEFLSYIFENSIFIDSNGYGDIWKGAYPLLEHVFLVDDLSTLSNPQEVFNTTNLHIERPESDMFIIAPNDRMILPGFPGVPDDPLGFWDIIVDNSLDVNGDTVTDDDYHTSIVNNNVINNYYVSDDVKINVPVDWFENPYTDQMYEESSNFIDFAKDCIDCLGDFDIYMYGAIVVGLAGGIVKKLLL